MDKEKLYEELDLIIKAFKANELTKLSIEELTHYHSFVSEYGHICTVNIDLLNRICEHIRTLIALKNKEKLDEARHHEIQNKLEELKKPHWTVNPTFWVSLVAMIAACIAAYFTVFPRSSQPASGGQKPLGTKPSVQSDVSKSQKPLSSSRPESCREKQK